MREQRPSAAPPVPSTASALARAVAMLGLAAAAHRAAAQTEQVYVDSSAPAGGNGTSWQQAFNSLTAACNAINVRTIDHDLEVRIAQGTYRAASRTPSSFTIAPIVTSSGITISILGAFAGLRGLIPDARDYIATPTILSSDVNGDDGANFANRADNAGSVLQVSTRYQTHSPGTMIDGLVLRGGKSSGVNGGAIFADGATGAAGVTVRQCLITDNEISGSGGGIAFPFGPAFLTVDSCRFSGNRATDGYGGGLYLGAVRAVVRNSVFEGNSATHGGGIFIFGANTPAAATTVDRCIVAGNTSIQRGGGVGIDSQNADTVTISNSLIVGNHSGSNGGGLQGARATITNCTLTGNSALQGGGIDSSVMARLTNCVIVANSATISGAQAFGIANSGVVYVVNFIGGNPRFTNPSGPDNNPSTWQDNDYHLLPGSPCIDRGDASLITAGATDLDGRSRIFAATPTPQPLPDLGCYEFQHRNCPADTNDDQGVTIDDLLIFLDQLQLGDLRADFAGMPVTDFPDGGVTIDDLLFYLTRFDAGC